MYELTARGRDLLAAVAAGEVRQLMAVAAITRDR